MEYVFRYNQSSTDKRVNELKQMFIDNGYEVLDFSAESNKKGIYYIEPRVEINNKFWQAVVKGSLVFGYQPEINGVPDDIKYISLNDDEKFIQVNNQLTANAFRQILEQDYHGKTKKILICGYGKLTTALEKVLNDWKIGVLNFNWHKMDEISSKYSDKAYFKIAPFHEYPIIVNTIPCPLIQIKDFKEVRIKQKIYDLASAPFGFDWSAVDKEKYDYQILPGLPGKFYPREAASAVFDTIQRYLVAHEKPALVLCITGSACSFTKMIPILNQLVESYEIYPVMSPNANVPNRFIDHLSFQSEVRHITGHEIITTIAGAEKLSSITKLRGSIVFPATGNTLAKLAHGITDTCVLMAVKALLRNNKPCIIGLSTNDALSGSAKNIGELLNRRNYYFVPFRQDMPSAKPNSCVCDFNQLLPTVDSALRGEQLQPVLLGII